MRATYPATPLSCVTQAFSPLVHHSKAKLFLSKGPFNLLPNNANEFNAIFHLFSQGNNVCAQVLCLPQTERCNPAGVLQPPILWGLGVSRRCHVFAHLVEVVRLRSGCGDIEFFDMFGSDMNDFIDVL